MDAPNLSRTLMRIERGTSALGANTETTRLDPLTCRVRLLQLRIPGFALVITTGRVAPGRSARGAVGEVRPAPSQDVVKPDEAQDTAERSVLF